MRMALLGAALLALTGAVSPAPAHAAACNGYVGLTFDDGPSNRNTPALLNALRQNGLRATMFNEGQYAAAYPAQVRAQVSAGMWVGNHSYTHPHLTQQSQSQMDSEISRTQQAIAAAGGGTPKLFRPPYRETKGVPPAAGRNKRAPAGRRREVRPAADHLGRRFAGLKQRERGRDRRGQRPPRQ